MKSLLITGASRGIGAAIAKLAAARGYMVFINYRYDTESADQVVKDISDAGGKAVALRADVSIETDVIEMFDKIDKGVGSLDALVNNAGIVAKGSRLADMSLERIEHIFKTNVYGTLLCSREAVKRMSTDRGGKGGAIVNISSGAAVSGSPSEYLDYASSKGAIDTFTVGLAREVAKEGIRVNAIRPGYIDTEIHNVTGIPGRVEDMKKRVPMGRLGKPEEIATAVLWLLSEEASYATGTIVDVAGGK